MLVTDIFLLKRWCQKHRHQVSFTWSVKGQPVKFNCSKHIPKELRLASMYHQIVLVDGLSLKAQYWLHESDRIIISLMNQSCRAKLFGIALALVISLAECASSKVLILDDDNFDDITANSKDDLFIDIYAPWYASTPACCLSAWTSQPQKPDG